MNKIISLIPAREGSKGIPKKNIKLLAGYPLMAWAIIASKLSTKIERTIVSTDSEEFAAIALAYGAEVPFLRPREFAQDNSLDIDYVKHAIGWFKTYERSLPKYIVLLYPTTPLRNPNIIDIAIEKIMQNKDATSLRSAHEIKESPCKMFGIKDGFYVGLCPNDPRPEYYQYPRQSFPPVYHPNGHVDIIKPEIVIKTESLLGPRILPFITPDAGELDRPEDFDFIEFSLSRHGNPVYEYLEKNFLSKRKG